MLSRTFLRACVAAPQAASLQVSRSMSQNTSGSFKKREQAEESQAVYRHEQELIRKLQQQVADMEKERVEDKKKNEELQARVLPPEEVDTPEEITNRISSLEKELEGLRGKLKK